MNDVLTAWLFCVACRGKKIATSPCSPKPPPWLKGSIRYNGSRAQHAQVFNYVREVATCARQ